VTVAVAPRSAAPPAPPPSTAWRAWVGVLAAGLLVGLTAFLYQWSSGLGVTGMSNTVTWGMYIVSFMFLVGASAGGLIVVAGSELVGSERFRSLSRLAVVVSVAAVATAAGSILPDLGRPELAWRMITQPHLTSPLVWDLGVLASYLVIGGVDLYLLSRPAVPQRTMRLMAQITLPLAVLVHSVTAWIFGLMVARPFWNTPLLAPLFITSALVSGTALVILVALVVRRTTDMHVGDETLGALGRLMLWFIAADGFLLAAEVLTTKLSGTVDHQIQLDVVLTGRLAPLFWSEVLLGMVVPFVVLSRPAWRVRPAVLATMSVLAVVGVFFKRINILLSSLFEPLVDLAPGLPGGRPGQSFTVAEVYIPTWVEWGVLVGMAAFFCALVTIGVQRIVLPGHRDDEAVASGDAGADGAAGEDATARAPVTG
jgi:molybdopterin-containing oxidoreductase family membrane subunit